MVNSLSCPKVTNPNSQNCPDLNNPSPMSDIDMDSVMGSGLGSQSGLMMGSGNLASLTIPDDCKQPEVKLEVLEELFGSGWDDHGLSMTKSPLSESSLSPPHSGFGSFSTSLLSTMSSQTPTLSLKSTSTLLAVSSAPSAAILAAARSIKVPLPGDLVSTFASSLSGFSPNAPPGIVSAAMAAAENGSLHIVIPTSNPGPDTTTSTVLSTEYTSPTINENAGSSSPVKKTVFTAKGKISPLTQEHADKI